MKALPFLPDDHILKMSDALSAGIVKQFPKRF